MCGERMVGVGRERAEREKEIPWGTGREGEHESDTRNTYRVCTSWARFLRLAVLKVMVLEGEESV